MAIRRCIIGFGWLSVVRPRAAAVGFVELLSSARCSLSACRHIAAGLRAVELGAASTWFVGVDARDTHARRTLQDLPGVLPL